MTTISRIITFFLLFSILTFYLSDRFSVVAKEEICTACLALEEKGFPPSYTKALCTLQTHHPAWRFTPLPITKISREEHSENPYDFSFVIASETAVEERNLVPRGEAFLPYADASLKTYDSGLYSASSETVAYFLDPRNFLSERGIFQFLDLRYVSETPADSVRAALKNAPAYADLVFDGILRAGEKTGVLPLYLAVLLYREQGTEGNPLLWGNAGEVLSFYLQNHTQQDGARQVLAPAGGVSDKDLAKLNHVYNPFHAGATGTGYFAVLYAGARHAKSQGWCDLEAGLCGGAEKIQKEYLSRYQNTPYLQKWNVDARSRTEAGQSRNFWGQYMQNITGALTMGEDFYTVLQEAGLLDKVFHFLIPVYEAMPSDPAPDPAGGACPLTAQDESAYSSHSALLPAEQFAVAEPAESQASPPVPTAPKHRAWGVGIACAAAAIFVWGRKKLPPKNFGGR